MPDKTKTTLNRRLFLGTSAAAVGGLAIPVVAQSTSNSTEFEPNLERARHNISSFRTLNWQPYFDNLRNGAVLVDTTSRALHFWSEDRSLYKPVSYTHLRAHETDS